MTYYTKNNNGEIVVVSALNAPSNAKWNYKYVQRGLLTDNEFKNIEIIKEYFDIIENAIHSEERIFFEVNDLTVCFIQYVLKVCLISLIKKTIFNK